MISLGFTNLGKSYTSALEVGKHPITFLSYDRNLYSNIVQTKGRSIEKIKTRLHKHNNEIAA
jgi:hypothetical protein